MVRRGELTDRAWARIEPLLPVADGRGRPWRGHRQVIDEHAAGARKRGDDGGTIDTRQSQNRQAPGRSRGGSATRLHLIVESRGLPMTLHLTGGNVVDCTVFEAVMAEFRLRRPSGGRPRTRPVRLLGDKGHSTRKIRLRRRGIKAVIPERRDQIASRRRKGSGGGRPPAFDALTYKQRNLVERCIGKLKQRRAIATRFDKLASRYLAGVTIASLRLWLRHTEMSDTP
ncbi:IS5 family transposase [Sphaerisporangium sp. NPDC051011]|uniref:IS5 family transposase n=1 Tax=Sphaerisporangium sp. NPDC051011 TaxID=3155792 RepID=UPI0033FB3A8B